MRLQTDFSFSILSKAAETGSGKTGVSRATPLLISFFTHLLHSKQMHWATFCSRSPRSLKHFFPFDHQAFSIPVIQIVYETLKDQQEGKKGRASVKTGGASKMLLINMMKICCDITKHIRSVNKAFLPLFRFILVFNNWQMNPYDRSPAFGMRTLIFKDRVDFKTNSSKCCCFCNFPICFCLVFLSSSAKQSALMDCAARAGSLKSGTAAAPQKVSQKVRKSV